jgi:hypothetical protein
MFTPLDALVSNFHCCHRYFQTCIFRVARGWQQPPNLHRQTIARRGNRPASEAIADVEFMASLRRALADDFGLARTGLHDPLVLADDIRPSIHQLGDVRLEDVTPADINVLWDLVACNLENGSVICSLMGSETDRYPVDVCRTKRIGGKGAFAHCGGRGYASRAADPDVGCAPVL